MRTWPAFVLSTLLCTSATALWAGPIGECADGRCAAKASLTTLGDTPPGNFGGVYENSRQGPGDPGATTGSAGCLTCRRAEAPTAAFTREKVADVPAPKAANEEKSDGIGGFLNKHKWQIGGALAGGLASLALGGGIFGLLIGLVVSVAVAFVGPKIFSGAK